MVISLEIMVQPDELKKTETLLWSSGTGVDVWAMFCAARTGDTAALKTLLAKEPALVQCHYIYRTPLYFAVRENQLEAAQLLLDKGADPIGLAVNDSLLEIAADRGFAQMQKLLEDHLAFVLGTSPAGEEIAAVIRARDLSNLRKLLDDNPRVLHSRDRASNQPIHWATMTRNLESIDELLLRGADINAKRADGARSIQLVNGDYNYRGWRDVPDTVTTTAREVLEHLRKRGADVDICTAAHIGDLDRVRELLDNEPSLANRVSEYVTYYVGSGSPLRNAAAAGNIAIVSLLLARGADPNLREEGIAPKGHALYAAVTNGHYEVAKLLLEHGAFPNPPVESSADALSIALGKSDQKMIELLCSYGAARSVDLLAYSDDVETAAAVFAANPVMARNTRAFANAAVQGHEAFLRLMLRYDPDLPKRLPANDYWLFDVKTPELIEFLFQRGMDPSRPNWLGVTPLHHFAMKGDIVRAAMYLDHGADLNARDEDISSTPLAWAAKFGKAEMVSYLLGRGAARQLPDDPEWATPIAWAKRRGHQDVVELLEPATA